MKSARPPIGALLGAAGLLCAGPLAATLLVGRTGAVPSLRWLGVCFATWVSCGAVGWAPAQRRFGRALGTLAPTAAVAVFLPWAYVDDQTFHALARSSVAALASLAGLALLGLTWQAARRGGVPSDEAAARARGSPSSPVLVATLVGLVLMYGLNDVLFEPLGAAGAGALAPLRFLAGAVPAMCVALAIRLRLVRPLEAGAVAATAGVSAFLAVWLGVAPAGAGLFAVAAAGLVALSYEELWQAIDRRARVPLVVLAVSGFALAATDLQKYGLAAREPIAAAPELARLLPAIGALALAGAIAFGLAAQTSRNAATGGTRDA